MSHLILLDLVKLRQFKTFLVNHDFDLLEILTKLKAIVVDPDEGFIPGISKNKSKSIPLVSTIALKNKYQLLSDKNNDSNNMEIANPTEGDLASGYATTLTQNQNTSLLHRNKRKMERNCRENQET